MSNKKIFSTIFFLILIILSILVIFTAFSSNLGKEEFSAKIFYLNNIKYPYYAILYLDSKYTNNKYLVEVFYKNKNRLVYSHLFQCKYNHCEKKIRFLNSMFIGDYKIKISLINKKKFEFKTLNFNITQVNPGFNVELEPKYFVKDGKLVVSGKLIFNPKALSLFGKFSNKNDMRRSKTKFFVLLQPNSVEGAKKEFTFTCLGFKDCYFQKTFKKDLVLGDYDIFISDRLGSVKRQVKVLLYNESLQNSGSHLANTFLDLRSNSKEKRFKRIGKYLVEDYFKSFKVDKSKLLNSIKISKNISGFKIDNGTMSSILKNKGFLDKVKNSIKELELKDAVSTTALNKNLSNNQFLNSVPFKPLVVNNSGDKTLANRNFNSIISYPKVYLKEKFLTGDTKLILLNYSDLDTFRIDSGVSKVELNILNGNLNNKTDFAEVVSDKVALLKGDLNCYNLNITQKIKGYNLHSTDLNTSFLINNLTNVSQTSKLNTSVSVFIKGREVNLRDLLKHSKMKPGYYKVKSGNQTNIYAFGLVSVNTKKPLYHPGETAEFLIVVLDKRGFPVSNSNVILNVKDPEGKISVLSTDSSSLKEISKGVYYGVMNVNNIGRYNLYVEAKERDGAVVNIESYFYVQNSFPFDILRDVPPTIDPWSGPFLNNFTIKSYDNQIKGYNFYEYIPKDFKIFKSNADKIYLRGENKVLVWKNLSIYKQFHPYYIANSPLVSPYLYELGRAKIVYLDKFSKKQVFFENRSWLFAIDPAAKVCGDESACICGTACNGGSEPGDGTIDSCTDGDTDWEFVKDIRVTDLNHSYFGTGDTVEICVDYDCDSSGWGDRITIGYKDARTSWADSDIIREDIADTTDIVTMCVNQTLNDYEGVHNVRGKVVWEGTAGIICSGEYYRDHDDINFSVLKTRPAAFQVWNLSNGTDTGDNLYLIRGENLSAFASWDRPVDSCNVTHNGSGSFLSYNKLFAASYWSNFTLDTTNLTRFSSVGPVGVNITCSDHYFGLLNTTAPQKNFIILGSLKINQSILNPYIMYNGTTTTEQCQVVDKNVGVPYSGITVYFYNNVTGLLGTNVTDANGWASYSYTENNIGVYNIICNVTDDLSNYFIKSDESQSSNILTVKENGTDITPPVVNTVTVNPDKFSVGGVTTIDANVTDNINLDSVYLNVTLPNGVSYSYPMSSFGGDMFEYNFSNSVLDGLYHFYIYAYDNSSNKGWSNTFTFTVTGIRTFIGIKTTKDIYKIGEDLNLTPYSKVSLINTSVYTESGDTGYIYYDFDSNFNGWTSGGVGDEWENGIPSSSILTSCDSGNCLGTDLDGNYNSGCDQWVSSPIINLTGRYNVKIDYWRELVIDRNAYDKAYFEISSDGGTSWSTLYENTVVPTTYFHLAPGNTLVYATDLDNSSQALLRFRLVANTDSDVYDGWAVDSINISFDPRKDWAAPWQDYDLTFGTDVDKLTAIKIGFNITGYSASGSVANLNNMPDLEMEIYNGTDYDGDYHCHLDSSKLYPYYCEFVVKNTPEFLSAWENSSNRKIRVRTINLDHNDYVTWTDIKKEYIIPSIIENHGESTVSSFLLEQFRNSTGGLVQTMYNQSVSLVSGEARELSDYWSFKVPDAFTLGAYYAYVALTDFSGNVLFNNDDHTPINDSYIFYIQSLLINVITPPQDSVQNASFLANITLDTTYFGSGGWCAYNLDNSSVNVTMNSVTSTNYDSFINGLPDGEHSLVFYCNDTDNYIVYKKVTFNVSEPPKVYFVPPTDLNGSVLNRTWVNVNVTLNDTSNCSLFVDFNRTLQSYWNFENYSGTNVEDFTLYNRDLTLEGGAVISNEDQIHGHYAKLDGVDDYLNASSVNSLFNNPTEFSFSIWVKLNDLSKDMDIISKGLHSTTNPILLWRDEVGAISGRADIFSVLVSGDGLTARIEGSSDSANDSEWHNLVVVFKANSSDGLKLYIDGVEDPNSPVSTIGIYNLSSNLYDLLIGKSESSGYEFNGDLDEILFFSRALTSNEIEGLYKIKNSWMFNRYDFLKNDPYNFYACGIDKVGNMNCTEERTVLINRTLPTIDIISPFEYEKFENNDTIWFNVSLSESAVNISKVWLVINDNGTKYYLGNNTLFNWSYSLTNFSSGWYNVTFYGEDIFGNDFNSSVRRFIVIPDKFASVKKVIRYGNLPNLLNTYIILNNSGKWVNYKVLDFYNSKYQGFYSTPFWNDSFYISGLNFIGNVTLWNVSVPTLSSFTEESNFTRKTDSFDKNLFIVGLD